MQTLAAPQTIDPHVAASIRERLANSRRLIATGRSKSAAILLWSAFETAVRSSLTDLGQQTDDPIDISETPQGLATQAVAYGVIDPDDRDVLLRLLPIAHGDAEDVDARLLQELSRFTERTLDEMQPQQDRSGQSTAKEKSMAITSTQFIAFAAGLAGTTVLTATSKPFAVAVRGGGIYVTPQSTGLELRRFTANSVQLGLSVYSQSASMRPTDYSKKIAHSSYFVGLLMLYLAQAQQQASRTNQQ